MKSAPLTFKYDWLDTSLVFEGSQYTLLLPFLPIGLDGFVPRYIVSQFKDVHTHWEAVLVLRDDVKTHLTEDIGSREEAMELCHEDLRLMQQKSNEFFGCTPLLPPAAPTQHTFMKTVRDLIQQAQNLIEQKVDLQQANGAVRNAELLLQRLERCPATYNLQTAVNLPRPINADRGASQLFQKGWNEYYYALLHQLEDRDSLVILPRHVIERALSHEEEGGFKFFGPDHMRAINDLRAWVEKPLTPVYWPTEHGPSSLSWEKQPGPTHFYVAQAYEDQDGAIEITSTGNGTFAIILHRRNQHGRMEDLSLDNVKPEVFSAIAELVHRDAIRL